MPSRAADSGTARTLSPAHAQASGRLRVDHQRTGGKARSTDGHPAVFTLAVVNQKLRRVITRCTDGQHQGLTVLYRADLTGLALDGRPRIEDVDVA